MLGVLHKAADGVDVLKDQLGFVEAELEREAIIRVEDDHRVALVLADLGAGGSGGFSGSGAHGIRRVGVH